MAELIQLKGGCYSNVGGRYVRYRWKGLPLQELLLTQTIKIVVITVLFVAGNYSLRLMLIP